MSKKNKEQNLEYKEKVSIDDKIRKKDNVIDYGNRKDKNSKIDKSEKKIIKEEEEIPIKTSCNLRYGDNGYNDLDPQTKKISKLFGFQIGFY